MNERKILLPAHVLERLERDGIPADRVRALISEAEKSGLKFQIGSDYCASRTTGTVTLWAVYRPVSDGIEVISTYHHRMQLIAEEEKHD